MLLRQIGEDYIDRLRLHVSSEVSRAIVWSPGLSFAQNLITLQLRDTKLPTRQRAHLFLDDSLRIVPQAYH